MEKNVKMSWLLDFYSAFLTKKQKDMMDLYYNQNFSLAEIAQEVQITRQGVRDLLQRAEHQLQDMEEKLGIAKRYLLTNEEIEGCLAMLNQSDLANAEHKQQLEQKLLHMRALWEDIHGV